MARKTRVTKTPARLTHFDEAGRAHMVDVSAKAATRRVAVASGHVTVSKETMRLIRAGQVKKGDVLSVAELAGIMGAKKTSELIPLCHPLALSAVSVVLKPNPRQSRIEITATVRTTGPTGVEMEALTAVSVAALTVYDMCKAADRAMVLGDIRLEHKSGGKSGVYERTR
ncbi:cyclic pyranopterin monophosphate synthase accessory protein [Hypericibacter adhaerens]|uniref:Cyclic pyranopterin monophosphate synthase n=1 Tax=Hypericibacter adhaerens TaxID=2602016 RepID=A0A5J6MY74_9PROT|nr:cyclic pyranopterin monophosphate synthase MoaC [Hypericibacter adhaerens]QEX22311.1 cyclic pyranopterin monophosphate synthase accessory protein [Hypericibacter adhaerens]